VERKHGGNVYQVARQLGVKVETIIDFSASINPLGYSPRIKKALSSYEHAIINYPDTKSYDFLQALSSYHDLPPENFIGGNGSTEFIHLLPGIIRPKSVLIVAPAFTEYEHSFQRAKGVVFYFDTYEKDRFEIQKKRLVEELKRGYSALYICNPGNPTGGLLPAETMNEIVTFACKKGTNVIADETFMDFSEKHSIKHHVKNFDNLFVLRSMTKFFALPGLRAGYMILHARAVERFKEKQVPWSMNALAQQAGSESLNDSAYIKKTIKYIQEARSALVAELKKISSLTVFNSSANFLLLKLNESARVTTGDIYEKLLQKGIVIRTCEDFKGLGERFFRIAVKKKNENKKLVTELQAILKAKKQKS